MEKELNTQNEGLGDRGRLNRPAPLMINIAEAGVENGGNPVLSPPSSESPSTPGLQEDLPNEIIVFKVRESIRRNSHTQCTSERCFCSKSEQETRETIENFCRGLELILASRRQMCPHTVHTCLNGEIGEVFFQWIELGNFFPNANIGVADAAEHQNGGEPSPREQPTVHAMMYLNNAIYEGMGNDVNPEDRPQQEENRRQTNQRKSLSPVLSQQHLGNVGAGVFSDACSSISSCSAKSSERVPISKTATLSGKDVPELEGDAGILHHPSPSTVTHAQGQGINPPQSSETAGYQNSNAETSTFTRTPPSETTAASTVINDVQAQGTLKLNISTSNAFLKNTGGVELTIEGISSRIEPTANHFIDSDLDNAPSSSVNDKSASAELPPISEKVIDSGGKNFQEKITEHYKHKIEQYKLKDRAMLIMQHYSNLGKSVPEIINPGSFASTEYDFKDGECEDDSAAKPTDEQKIHEKSSKTKRKKKGPAPKSVLQKREERQKAKSGSGKIDKNLGKNNSNSTTTFWDQVGSHSTSTLPPDLLDSSTRKRSLSTDSSCKDGDARPSKRVAATASLKNTSNSATADENSQSNVIVENSSASVNPRSDHITLEVPTTKNDDQDLVIPSKSNKSVDLAENSQKNSEIIPSSATTSHPGETVGNQFQQKDSQTRSEESTSPIDMDVDMEAGNEDDISEAIQKFHIWQEEKKKRLQQAQKQTDDDDEIQILEELTTGPLPKQVVKPKKQSESTSIHIPLKNAEPNRIPAKKRISIPASDSEDDLQSTPKPNRELGRSLSSPASASDIPSKDLPIQNTPTTLTTPKVPVSQTRNQPGTRTQNIPVVNTRATPTTTFCSKQNRPNDFSNRVVTPLAPTLLPSRPPAQSAHITPIPPRSKSSATTTDIPLCPPPLPPLPPAHLLFSSDNYQIPKAGTRQPPPPPNISGTNKIQTDKQQSRLSRPNCPPPPNFNSSNKSSMKDKGRESDTRHGTSTSTYKSPSTSINSLEAAGLNKQNDTPSERIPLRRQEPEYDPRETATKITQKPCAKVTKEALSSLLQEKSYKSSGSSPRKTSSSSSPRERENEIYVEGEKLSNNPAVSATEQNTTNEKTDPRGNPVEVGDKNKNNHNAAEKSTPSNEDRGSKNKGNAGDKSCSANFKPFESNLTSKPVSQNSENTRPPPATSKLIYDPITGNIRKCEASTSTTGPSTQRFSSKNWTTVSSSKESTNNTQKRQSSTERQRNDTNLEFTFTNTDKTTEKSKRLESEVATSSEKASESPSSVPLQDPRLLHRKNSVDERTETQTNNTNNVANETVADSSPASSSSGTWRRGREHSTEFESRRDSDERERRRERSESVERRRSRSRSASNSSSSGDERNASKERRNSGSFYRGKNKNKYRGNGRGNYRGRGGGGVRGGRGGHDYGNQNFSGQPAYNYYQQQHPGRGGGNNWGGSSIDTLTPRGRYEPDPLHGDDSFSPGYFPEVMENCFPNHAPYFSGGDNFQFSEFSNHVPYHQQQPCPPPLMGRKKRSRSRSRPRPYHRRPGRGRGGYNPSHGHGEY